VTQPAAPFKLTQTELDSALWKRIEREITARLDTHRITNDSVSLDAQATARIRGQIAELKHLLTWAVKDPTIE